MNKTYIHHKKNNINLIYLIVLTLLVLFGFYKNGILVYKYFSNNIIMLLKPLLFSITSLITSFGFEFIKNKKLKLSDNLIYSLLLSVIIPINTGLIIFFIINIIFNLINYYVLDKINLEINIITIFKLIIVLLLLVLNKYSYLNNLELVGKYSYNLIDIFIGRGVSGVSSSSILIMLAGFIALFNNFYYKNDIPIISLLTYIIIAVLFKLILHEVFIINGLIIFSLLYIAPLNKFSPAVKKERIIYSVFLGILTAVFTYFINMYDGVTLAILIASFLNLIHFK